MGRLDYHSVEAKLEVLDRMRLAPRTEAEAMWAAYSEGIRVESLYDHDGEIIKTMQMMKRSLCRETFPSGLPQDPEWSFVEIYLRAGHTSAMPAETKQNPSNAANQGHITVGSLHMLNQELVKGAGMLLTPGIVFYTVKKTLL